LLRQYRVDTLVLTGQHSNMCVRHTAADAFFRGYRIVVPTDGVEAFSDEDQASGLAYLRQVYKAETPLLGDLL
jgi:nicotinamidase-related amidase